MRRSPRTTVAVIASAAIIIALAPPAWAEDQNDDGAVITEQSASTDEAPTARVILSTAEAEEVRADLNYILDTLRGMVLTLSTGDSQELMAASMRDAQENLTKMSDEDLAVYAEAIPGIAHLREAVDELAAILLSEDRIGRQTLDSEHPE